MSQGLGFSTLSYGGIEEISENLNKKAGAMSDLLNDIELLFKKIGQEDVWSGEAAQNALEKFKTLSGKFPDFYNAVMECSNYLNNMLSDYRAADAEVQKLQINIEE